MNLSDFDYKYPEKLVAQRPAERRDASRMMFVDKKLKAFKHSSIKDLPTFLKKGDLLVVNNSKVFSARLFGKKDSGSNVEILLLKEIEPQSNIWSAIASRKKRLKIGDKLTFNAELKAEILENGENSILIRFFPDRDIYQLIEKIGLPPLPPYIKRKTAGDYTEEDRERYQTIYAKHKGSAAAPTAGLHLTKDILYYCESKGVETASVTLHVGLDTFSPVRTENIEDHKIHGETYFIREDSAEKIFRAKKDGRRIVAVGTTTVRALESSAAELHCDRTTTSHRRETTELKHTSLYITPSYKFRVVDALLTNFHQPKSTLLMMVCAFAERKFIMQIYDEAIKNQYRLFSYGDCMLIV